MKPFASYFKDPSRIPHLSPALLYAIGDVILYCLDHRIEPCITDTVSSEYEDLQLKRTSSTHREGRAFDLSTKGWSQSQIDIAIGYFEIRFQSIGALGSDGRPRPVVYHDAGTGFHLHFQLHRRFAMPVRVFEKLT